MTIRVVYAVGSEVVRMPDGNSYPVQKGSHWPEDDPVVRFRPELFSDDARYGMLYSREPDGYDAPVEQATAAPGERRNVRRRT